MNVEQAHNSIRFLGQLAREMALEQPDRLAATLDGIVLCKTQGIVLDCLLASTASVSAWPASGRRAAPRAPLSDGGAGEAQPALDASAHFDAGNQAMQAQALDTALAHFSMAVALQPQVPEYCFNLGNAWAAKGEYAEAVRSYDRALAQRPDYAHAQCNRGNALYQQGDLEAALDSLDQAIHLQPDLAIAHLNRGNTLVRLQRFDAAVHDYETAMVCNPELSEAAFNKRLALEIMRSADAADSR